MPAVFVSASGTHFHHNALKWPPHPPLEGEAVLAGGYPQMLRQSRVTVVDVKFQWLGTLVSSVTRDHIVLDVDIDTMTWVGAAGEEKSYTTSLGGVSGGPVYRVIEANREKGELVDRMELVGIIDRQLMGNLVLARPVAHVRADGTLIKRNG